MTLSSLLIRGLRHYWRWHLGLFAGVAAAAAVISGSLVTGDSVRATLAHQADLRLGKVATAAASVDGFFTESLADRGKADAGAETAAPVLLVQGTVSSPGDTARANGVNIFGVRDDFQALAGSPGSPLTGLEVNRALASALKLPPGAASEVIVRFEKPGLLSRDAPLSGEADQTVTLRSPVSAVRADAEMGAFSLKAGQAPPLNLYLPLARLQEAAGLPGKANLLLSDATSAEILSAALRRHMTLEDAGLTLASRDGQHILSTGRIFVAPAVASSVRQSIPAVSGVLTYLVNEITSPGKGITPYSMATAAVAGQGGLPEDWPADSVLITQWLADDLGLKAGDTVSMKYFRVTRARGLEEAIASFPVHAVLPMDHPAVRREWTPDFPGVSESENCRDWKPGIPIRQEIIRDKDDAYWKQYKGTPKLFLPLEAGQKLWSNRFGDLTALWVKSGETPEALTAKILAPLTPADTGLQTVAVRESADRAVSEGMDFGALFVSMSAFLIGAALLLAVLLFVLGVEHRAGQIGLLRAVGWSPGKVRHFFVLEGAVVCVPAALIGALAGLPHAAWTLGSLESEWADAALGLTFVTTVKPTTLVIAWLGTVLLSLVAVWFVTRRISRAAPKALLAGAGLDETAAVEKKKKRAWRRWIRLPIGTLTAAAAVMLWFSPRVPQHIAPMMFFGAAAFLLSDGLRVLGWRLRKMERAAGDGPPDIFSMGARNAARRRGRSLAIAAMLAAGIFMVVALNAFRQDARLVPSDRGSGTGGFALVGETTLPVYEDLNTPAGRDAWGLEPEETEGVSVVAFRARDGEEASCLNLNRAQAPRVLGVVPEALASRKAFPFAAISPDFKIEPGASPWTVLDAPAESGAIPAIMDQYSAMFALGKNVGGEITVSDSQGRPVRLKLAGLLAGTVLQGNVIIGDKRFTELYPDTGGFRYFLIDAAPAAAGKWSAVVVKQLADRGLAVAGAADRLAQYQSVQNAYLTIFSTLGGLALVLSTAGLGVMVARHVLERRAEFALLTAVGFRRAQLRNLVLAEHWFLFLTAAALGTGAALIAVWPNLRLAGAGGIPVGLLASLLAALLAGGLLFCALAARLALGKSLTDSLRHE